MENYRKKKEEEARKKKEEEDKKRKAPSSPTPAKRAAPPQAKAPPRSPIISSQSLSSLVLSSLSQPESPMQEDEDRASPRPKIQNHNEVRMAVTERCPWRFYVRTSNLYSLCFFFFFLK